MILNKLKQKLTALIIIIVLIIISLGNPYSAWSEEPKLWANSAVLMDIKTGAVLYDKEGFKERHPASLTKIMTGILAIEYGDLQETVTVSKRAARISVGQTIRLQEGQKLTLEDLVYAAMLHSANDAAVAIAEHIGGTEEIFLKMMNQKALAIGATKTHFENPNGYTKPNHRTTAYDLALIIRYAMQNPTFSKIVGTKYKTIEKIGDGRIDIKNTNKMLKMYPGTLGGKTGTTAAAGGCLAAIAVNNGQTLIAVVLKSGDQRRYQDCINLFEYGFKEIKDYKICEKGELWEEIFISEGKPRQLKVITSNALTLRMTKEQYQKLEKKLSLNRNPQLPVNKGDKLGELRLYLDGQEISSVDLTAANAVKERTFWNNLWP